MIPALKNSGIQHSKPHRLVLLLSRAARLLSGVTSHVFFLRNKRTGEAMLGMPRGDDACFFSLRPPFGVRRITVSSGGESRGIHLFTSGSVGLENVDAMESLSQMLYKDIGSFM